MTVHNDEAGAIIRRSNERLRELLSLGPAPTISRESPQYKRASSILAEAEAEAKEDVPLTAFVVGVAHRVLGDYVEAITWFHSAASLMPELSQVWQELALCYGKVDNHVEAEHAARNGLRFEPASPAHLGNLSSALFAQGKLDEALEVINEAIKVDPADQLNQQFKTTIETQMAKQKPAGGILSWFARLKK